MREPLFDVVLSSTIDRERAGDYRIGVTITDRRLPHDGETITPRTEFRTLTDALEFARHRVSTWLKETPA